MKKFSWITISIIIFTFPICSWAFDIAKAKTLIQHAEFSLLGSESIEFEHLLIKKTKNDPDQIYRILVYKKGGNAIMKFLEPKVEQGRIVFIKDRTGYMFFPSSSKPMRVSLQSGLMGGGFTPEDIAGNLLDNFDIANQEIVSTQNENFYQFELQKKENAVIGYSKIIYLIRENGLPYQKYFYTLSGKLLKTLTLTENKELNGIETPLVWTMKGDINHEDTIVKVLRIKRDVTFAKNTFSISYIESKLR